MGAFSSSDLRRRFRTIVRLGQMERVLWKRLQTEREEEGVPLPMEVIISEIDDDAFTIIPIVEVEVTYAFDATVVQMYSPVPPPEASKYIHPVN